MVLNRLKKLHQVLMHYSVLFFLPLIIPFFFSVADAHAENRALKLYFVHTNERDEIVFKRNGKYDPAGLKRLNYFLRDWRRNEPTNMDPRLFDLIWSVYKMSGSSDYINVVSAYRSPTTNNMLRSRSKSSGVAKNSQHTLGHAMDFFLPDVKLSRLRGIGLKQQVGGVGYYPTSGSPFVHMDIGSVRHWPRMSRSELLALFPDGKTMHIPSDGRPLQGYQQALADYKVRQGAPIVTASAEPSKRGLLNSLFGRKNNTPASNNTIMARAPSVSASSAPIPAKAPVPSVELPGNDAPIPSFSPFHNNIEDDDEDSMVAMAYANVPLPSYKPNSFNNVIQTPARDEMYASADGVAGLIRQSGSSADAPEHVTTVDQVVAMSSAEPVTGAVPVPVPAPILPKKAQEGIIAAVVPANTASVPIPGRTANSSVLLASVIRPQSKPHEIFAPSSDKVYGRGENVGLRDSQMIAASDQISKLIAEGYDETDNKQDNVTLPGAKPSSDELADLIDSNEKVIPVPQDEKVKTGRSDEYYYGRKLTEKDFPVVSTGNRPSRNLTNVSRSNEKKIIALDEELRTIPSMVFISQLEKGQDGQSQYSALSGKAVDFHPVTRVYKSN